MDMFSRSRRGPRVYREVGTVSRTKQSFRDECDINLIMARYVKSGVVDHVAKHRGSYGFATSLTFHDSMNLVVRAQSMFDELPAEVRKRFGNSPGDFLDFVQDPANAEAMREMGLGEPVAPEAIEPPAAPTVTPPAAPVEPEALPPVG